MSTLKIAENVYSVGTFDPGLRKFDIVMESKYGTSYNSYLITDQKTVLIDAGHDKLTDDYIYNLQSLIDIESIDYIIVNHTEPDHSGVLSHILDINPNIEIVCTFAANNNLKNILNKEFNSKVIKDGDTLNIGKGNLKFIVAPLLHWPDTMMTYYEEEKILFSCDFLGSHYCELNMLDTEVRYFKEYLQEFKYYYDCIMGPFKPSVLNGLNKISDLDIKLLCPSHGPILTKTISDRIADYKSWSTPLQKDKKVAAIVYSSAYGYTKSLAKAIYDVVSKEESIKTVLIDAVTTDINNIMPVVESADYFFIGSPTINRNVPKVMLDILSSIDAINTRNKMALAFGSYGWSGEAVPMLTERLKSIKYKVAHDGFRVVFKPTESNIISLKEIVLDIIK